MGGQGDPWFVAGKDLKTNQLIAVQGRNHPLLFTQTLYLSDLSWTLDAPPRLGSYQAKSRYRMPDAACELISLAADSATLTFREPQWAATPGQSAVLYDNDICLGGGVITSPIPEHIL